MNELDASRVHRSLYQGGKPPEGAAVRAAGFDALILCAQEHQAGKYDDVTIYRCSLNDDEDTHPLLLSEWNRAQAIANVVAGLLYHKRKVLVTCRQGRNRSGLVTGIALHLTTGWPGKKCVKVIRKARVDALTNDSFVEALEGL